ncbi:MAG: FTR1 family protein [Methylovirgula sp.]|uniref:FTR1 family iron permease n=1 Tax=Methylovirgula sp. TaxID=1978224 RepID=UPI0030762653
MFAALIIVFREVVEAGLVVGVVLAVTQNVPGRLRYVFGGVAAGIAGAGIVALFTGLIAEALAGSGQEVLNASVLGIAVVMLTWHNVWMARHGREMTQELSDFGQQVSRGSKSLLALAIVVAVAVLREGSEIVLFLYGVLVSGGTTVLNVFFGGVLGLIGGALVAYLTFRGLITIPMRHLFRVTTLLISFIAAGMAAQAIGFLDQADIVTTLDRTVWDTSWLLADDSWVGRVAHTLLGYTDQPTELQLIVYVTVLAVIFVLMKVFAPPRRPIARLAAN